MKWKVILTTVFLVASLILTGCAASEGSDDIGTWSVSVEVVGESPVEFTNEDASEIGPVEITAAVKDGEDLQESNTYTGILLVDFLDYLGVEEYSVISIESADGYAIELEPDRVDAEGTGLAWAINGETLDEESGPVKFVNNKRGPKWWVDQVSLVTIIK